MFVPMFDETQFGLRRINLDPTKFTIPVLTGKVNEVPVTLFTQHAPSDDIIEEVSPDAAAIVAKDRRTPGSRKRFVQSFAYLPFIKGLEEHFGTQLVNAHWIESPLTSRITVGLYWATAHFPDRMVPQPIRGKLDDLVFEDVKSSMEKAITLARDMGLSEETGVVGLGALTGTKPYSKHFARDGTLAVTNGNYLTGVATAMQIMEAVHLWRQVHGEEPEVGIVGATGATGSIASLIAAIDGSQRLTLSATENSRAGLPQLADQLRKLAPHVSINTIAAEDSALQTVHSCDIVVFLTSSASMQIPADAYQPGAIIIDAARPRANSDRLPTLRPDLIVGDGPTAIFQKGALWNPNLHRHHSQQLLWCMASTAYHALSGNYRHLMPPLNALQFDAAEQSAICKELWADARRHGFSLGPWQWHTTSFSLEERFTQRVENRPAAG